MTGKLEDAAFLRLALFSGNYNYVRDGANQALNRLVDYLERRGAQVLVMSPTAEPAAFEPAGELVSAPSIAIPTRSEYRFSLGLPKANRERLDAFAPNLVHISAPDLLGRSAVRYAHSRSIPAVASVHTRFDTYLKYYGLGWLEPRLRSYMRKLYGACAHVYAPSESMADALVQDGLVSAPRIWSRGVELDLFHPERRDLEWRRSLGFADDDVVVTFVGRLVLEKGIDIFAAAVKRAKAMGAKCRVLVVGDGPAKAHFETLAPDAVFVGFQSGEDLARAYASSDVFFNPSTTETFGNVTLEAMASGLPSVCADATGSRSLITPGETGYLAPPGDEEIFGAAIAQLTGDTSLRTQMGKAARARSLDYNWDAILGAVFDQYKELLPEYAHEREQTKRIARAAA